MHIKIAIVLDCTASMGPWIYEAKTKIRQILDHNQELYPNAHFKVALVAYRDYGDFVRMRSADFRNVSSIVEILNTIHAEGGDDEAEDVAGAFYAVSRLSGWETADVRLVFHITDAPAHGDAFHTANVSDRFPCGDPDHLDPIEFVEDFAQRGFQYTFVRITSKTDKMVDEFHMAYSQYGGVFRVVDLDPQSYDGRYGDIQDGDISCVLGPALSDVVSQSIQQYTSSQDM
jgi:hypothetical protein